MRRNQLPLISALIFFLALEGCLQMNNPGSASQVPFRAGYGYVVSGSTGVAGATGASLLDQAMSVGIDSQHRIIAAGNSKNSLGGKQVAIWRFTFAGVPDTTFGTNGVALSPSTGAAGAIGANVNDHLNNPASNLVIDSSDRIIVVGQSTNAAGGIEMAIWRFTSSGALDSSFGNGGIVVSGSTGAAGATGAAETDVAYTVALDSSGSIIVGGSSKNSGGNARLALWRYTSAGVLDTTFGTGGVALGTVNASTLLGGSPTSDPAFGIAYDAAYGIAIDSSGRILATGTSLNPSGGGELALWRFSSAGVIDTSFGTGGVAVFGATGVAGATGNSEWDEGDTIVLDSAGRILVGGGSLNSLGGYEMVIWRYNSSGAIDTSFGASGYVHSGSTGTAGATGATEGDWGNQVVIDSSGKILISGGSKNSSGGQNMAIWKFTSTGAADTSFGTAGYVLFGSPGAAGATHQNDWGSSLVIDSYGKLVVAGTSANSSGGTEMAIWRYLPSGVLDK